MGSGTPRRCQANEERDWQSSHTSILQSKKQTSLQTDASKKGLGACLLQDQKPVYIASKALTKAQKGYEVNESLAVAWLWRSFTTSCMQATLY